MKWRLKKVTHPNEILTSGISLYYYKIYVNKTQIKLQLDNLLLFNANEVSFHKFTTLCINTFSLKQ